MGLNLVMSTWNTIVELFKGDSAETAPKLFAVIGFIERVISLYKK